MRHQIKELVRTWEEGHDGLVSERAHDNTPVEVPTGEKRYARDRGTLVVFRYADGSCAARQGGGKSKGDKADGPMARYLLTKARDWKPGGRR